MSQVKYRLRRLAIWWERRRLSLATALVWCAKKIYDGPWNPPPIYNTSYGVLSHSLKVRRVGAEHTISRDELMRTPPSRVKESLEQHRREMTYRIAGLLIEHKFVRFTTIVGVDGLRRLRAGLMVVEQPTDITEKEW